MITLRKLTMYELVMLNQTYDGIGQKVVYVDDFKPDTIETVTARSVEWISFEQDRGAHPDMIRLAEADEIEQNKRLR